MAADQVTLVKSSFAHIRPVSEAVAARFYARLFELDPSLRALFHTDMTEQQRKLMQMLDAIVVALDQPAQILAEVNALGRCHRDYGVVADHYMLMEEALFSVFAQQLGECWTPEVVEAWHAAYTLVAGTMQAAAHSAGPERPDVLQSSIGNNAS